MFSHYYGCKDITRYIFHIIEHGNQIVRKYRYDNNKIMWSTIGSYTMECCRYVMKLLAFFLLVSNKSIVYKFEVEEFSDIKL